MGAHLITTGAGAGACSRCREPVIEGWSQGQHVRVDPYPVSSQIEVAALLAGRETYSLHTGQLVRRLGNSTVSGPVLMSHRCGYVLRPAAEAPPPAAPQAYVPPF